MYTETVYGTKYVVIGGVHFEVCKSTKYHGIREIRYPSIYDAYENPSPAKLQIWSQWTKWFSENSCSPNDVIGIASRNCYRFTITGNITIVSGENIDFVITSAHNIVYLKDTPEYFLKTIANRIIENNYSDENNEIIAEPIFPSDANIVCTKREADIIAFCRMRSSELNCESCPITDICNKFYRKYGNVPNGFSIKK